MKKKKTNGGFTIVELLVILSLLGILTIIMIPMIMNRLKEKSQEIGSLTLDMIYSATELYVKDYSNKFELKDGNTFCITLQELVEHERLIEPIIDVETGSTIPLDTKVAVILQDGKEKYEYDSEMCK